MEQTKYIYLYGASGHGKVIRDIVEASGHVVKAFIDDNAELEQLQGLNVLHEWQGLSPVIVSIGSNKVRKMVAERLKAHFATAIHPQAIVSPRARVGEGTVIMQGAIVQTEAVLGRHCIVNTGASIDHECEIEDFVHISPHATLCGNVHVGEGSWIGAGTTVIQGVRIGRWCTIGAGSVVTKDVPDGYLAVGNRCRLIRKIEEEM